MLNQRQIKARFRKGHLVKILETLLSTTIEYKGKEYPFYALRAKATPQQVADSIRFGEFHEDIDRRYDNGIVCHTYRATAYWKDKEGTWRYAGSLRINADDCTANPGRVIYPTKDIPEMSDEEIVDYWIQTKIMRLLTHLIKELPIQGLK